jgi:hypothetical protein
MKKEQVEYSREQLGRSSIERCNWLAFPPTSYTYLMWSSADHQTIVLLNLTRPRPVLDILKLSSRHSIHLTFSSWGMLPSKPWLEKSGITKQRGVRLAVKGHEGRTIMAAFHPAYALRNPGVHPTFVEDVRRFARAVSGDLQVRSVKKRSCSTISSVKRLRAALLALPPGTLVAYDFENRHKPWHKDWSATCLGFSWDGETSYVVPLYHPDSPFKKHWLRVLRFSSPRWNVRTLSGWLKMGSTTISKPGVLVFGWSISLISCSPRTSSTRTDLRVSSFSGADVSRCRRVQGDLDLKARSDPQD